MNEPGAASNRARQERFKQRMKAKGYRRYEVWIPQESIEALKAYVQQLKETTDVHRNHQLKETRQA